MAITDEAREKKNARVSARISETRKRRKSQRVVTRTLKFDLTRSKPEELEALTRLFLEAKWYTNHLISTKSWQNGRVEAKASTVKVKNHKGKFRTEPLLRLGSQIKQSIGDQLCSNELTLEKLKEEGYQDPGIFKLKHFVNSIPLSQLGITYKFKGKKVSFQKGVGSYRLLGFEQLKGLELSSAKLIREPSGFYLQVTGWEDAQPVTENSSKPLIGLDFGVNSHFTLSDGRELTVNIRETDRIKSLNKKLKRQIKGSKNYQKTRQALRREYEKVTRRKEAASQTLSAGLLAEGIVFTQDDPIKGWFKNSGKKLQSGITGRVKTRLKRNPSTIVLPSWVPTTQWCPSCGKKNKLPLSERVYSCDCGYSEKRDVHAARNMILLGLFYKALRTPGQELAGMPVEGLSVIATESATAMLTPKKRETQVVTSQTEGGKEQSSFPPEARLVSTVA